MYGEFELEIPGNLEEALALLAQGPQNVALAGGTNLMIDLRARTARPTRVVSLGALDTLRGIKVDDGHITLGARTTVSDILHAPEIGQFAPSLLQAAKVFAGQMVRNAATVGGNIACGSPAADLVPPLMSLGAEVILVGPSGTRQVGLDAYFLGYKQDCRNPGEIIAGVTWAKPPAQSFNSFYKLARRHGDAITVTGVAVLLTARGETCEQVRIALGAVAPTVMRVRKAELMLKGVPLTPALIASAAACAADECSPVNDVRASAEYRAHTVEALVRRLLTQGWEAVTGQGG